MKPIRRHIGKSVSFYKWTSEVFWTGQKYRAQSGGNFFYSFYTDFLLLRIGRVKVFSTWSPSLIPLASHRDGVNFRLVVSDELSCWPTDIPDGRHCTAWCLTTLKLIKGHFHIRISSREVCHVVFWQCGSIVGGRVVAGWHWVPMKRSQLTFL